MGSENLSSTGGPLEALTAATISPNDASPGLPGAPALFNLCDLTEVAADCAFWSPEPQPAASTQPAATTASQPARHKMPFFQRGPSITSSRSYTADYGKDTAS